MRDALVKGMNGCVKLIGLPACPKKCGNVPKLMKDCDEEDAAAAAASAAAESLSSALAASSSTAMNGPLETGSAAVSAPAAGETSAAKVYVHPISPQCTCLTVIASLLPRESRKLKRTIPNAAFADLRTKRRLRPAANAS